MKERLVWGDWFELEGLALELSTSSTSEAIEERESPLRRAHNLLE
jgi:hypothetical protein